jgi:hypothetical protein
MLSTRKILIVDDDPEWREALMEQLSLQEELKPLRPKMASCSPKNIETTRLMG